IPGGRTTNWIVGAIVATYVLSILFWGLDYAAVFGGFIPLRVTGGLDVPGGVPIWLTPLRSEEHTSELQSLMRISYAVFCLKKTTQIKKSMSSNITKL